MATLPSPTDIQRQIPRSRMSIPNISGGADDASRIGLGQTVARVGRIIREVEDHRATVQAEDAMNQLAMADNELQVKLQSIKNGDAANQDLLGNFTKEREARINEIKAGMKNSAAIGKFDSGVAKTAPRFGATVLQHQMTEAANYANVVHQGKIETKATSAGQNWSNEVVVNESAESLRVASEARATALGITDKDARSVAIQSEVGQIYVSAIDGALDGGNSALASRYLELNRPNMTQKQIDYAEKRIKPNADWQTGVALADEYQRKVESGIPAKKAFEEMRSASSGNKSAFDNAKGVIDENNAIVTKASQHASGTSLMNYEDNPTRQSAQRIYGSREYLSMTDADKASVKKYIENDLELKDRRADADKADDPEVYAKFMEILDSPGFTKMNTNQIFALRTVVGKSLDKELLAEHQRRLSGAAKFQIDKDILNIAMPKELKKQDLRAFRGIVEHELLKWKTSNPGKLPTIEDQERIAGSANDVWKDMSGWWDSNEPRYRAEGKGLPLDIYQTLKDVPGSDKDKIAFYNEFKASGAKMTPDQYPTYFRKWKELMSVETGRAKEIPR